MISNIRRNRMGTVSFDGLFNGMLTLKAEIFASAHGKAGTNRIVYTDNSAALEVFGGASC